ncbi:unnamed protein product [Urochloa decumbens]|uniref:Uncharacterized protein n=1 Tax=Urochloa decumbens TaxID=240449 RepID=A0ABC8VDQ2_9POAL
MATDSEVVTTRSEEASATAPEADSLEIVVGQKLRQHDGDGESSSMSIFRVPAHIRDANKELYEPRLVSIGPYYRGRAALRAMEQHKWRLLRELLSNREHHPGILLGMCVKAVRGVEQHARCCYSERTDNDVEGFAEMLLLDGCFIIQFFAKLHNKEEDPLCDVGWGLPLLLSDLLLLENQIPFRVLEELFRVVAPDAETWHLRSLLLPHIRSHFSSLYNKPSTHDVLTRLPQEIHHLLHLFYEAIVPNPRRADMVMESARKSPSRLANKLHGWFRAAVRVRDKFTLITQDSGAGAQPPPLLLPSVTMLREAGVRFAEKKSPRHMFDITFDKASGVMEMPRVQVDQANKPLFVNLLAFEQTSRGHGGGDQYWLSSYTALMSFLVKTGKDVEQLQKRGIMDSLLDSNDDAATGFFQQLGLGGCSSLDYEEHRFQEMFADLRQYYDSSWHKHKAEFLRDHCRSPWAIIALAAAMLAVGFTLFKVSTAIYSLVRPGH